MDDTVFGLSNFDDINGLDLPSLAVPADTPGNGLLIPSGVPFNGGATTPRAPGTPGGPPLGGPPPGGLECVRVGLCITEFSDDCCDITLRVSLSCVPRPIDIDVKVPCDDGNPDNGSELDAAVTMMAAALAGLTVPPGSGPDSGKPVFAGPGLINRASRGHTNATLRVNPRLRRCNVTGVATIMNGCDCYTQNVAPKPSRGRLPDLQVKLDTERENPGGLFMLQIGENGRQHLIEVVGGTAQQIKRQIFAGLFVEGFEVEYDDDGALCVTRCPNGRPCQDVWGAGFIRGGNGHLLVGMTWKLVQPPGLDAREPDLRDPSDLDP